MAYARPSSAVPERMSRACARFFAADWEASSFLEFFVDLKLRVAEDQGEGAGRTLTRLSDHARFALQITLVRSVDSFVAYLAEIAEGLDRDLPQAHWTESTKGQHPATKNIWWRFHQPSEGRVSVGSGLEYASALAYGNVRRLDYLFFAATDIQLFVDHSEYERIGRLSALRNLITHGRIFAAEDLASFIDETASVPALRLEMKTVRDDLDFLRVVVKRIDGAAAATRGVDRPVSSQRLFEAVGRAMSPRDAETSPRVERFDS